MRRSGDGRGPSVLKEHPDACQLASPMSPSSGDSRFQVDLAGIIGLLSDHIYSGPHVYLRELIQNGVDAISARRKLEGAVEGKITLRIERGEATEDQGPRLVVTDNGIGLNEEEIHRFLATIGQSAKRGELVDRSDYIGQFGVGLLSAFVVSDEIEVLTRRRGADASEGLRWLGRRDGTYRVEPAGSVLAEGTTVVLRPRPDMLEWFEPERVLALGRRFARLLPYEIELLHGGERQLVTGGPPPWKSASKSASELSDEILAFGHEVLGSRFNDFIPLHCEQSGLHGVAYVRPTAINVSAPQRHRVYVKGMLVSEGCDNLLPPWAGFVQAVVDARDLRPTASREHLYEDQLLIETRATLGDCIRRWLRTIALAGDGQLARLMSAHALALRNYALHDDEFLSMIMDEFIFETAKGHQRFGDYRREQRSITYAATVDEFRQCAPIALAQGINVINAGHVHEVDLLLRAAESLPGLEVERLDGQALLAQLHELSLEERRASADLLAVAAETLRPLGLEGEVRAFHPTGLPALYVSDDESSLMRTASLAKETVNPLWAGVLDDLLAARVEPLRASLVFNYRNPLVQRLLRVDDRELLMLIIRLLYVQTMLLAQRPLSAHEIDILNDGLLQLIERSMGPGGNMLQ